MGLENEGEKIELRMEYPYYIVPDVEEYHKLDPDSEEAERLRRRISVNVGDPESLQRILGGHGSRDMDVEKTRGEEISPTAATIDSFLEKFGDKISSPVFPNTEEREDKHIDDTLSKLLKANRFEEAIKLIEAQNLNNPQKSVYFALQIRFIKKLKAIHNWKGNNKTT